LVQNLLYLAQCNCKEDNVEKLNYTKANVRGSYNYNLFIFPKPISEAKPSQTDKNEHKERNEVPFEVAVIGIVALRFKFKFESKNPEL
jgi:hypothetical protein